MSDVATQSHQDTKVTKSTIEKYSVQVRPHGGWAIICLDETIGLLQIHSDYGDWAHHWSSPGRPFKAFLLEIDNHYLMGKLGARDWFDDHKTVKEVKKVICEKRRRHFHGDVVTKDVARQAWEDVDHLDISRDSFCAELMHSDALSKVFEDYCDVPLVMDFPPGLRMFMEKLWPVFKSYLREELTAVESVKSAQSADEVANG